MYKIKNQDTKRIIQIGTSNNWLKISTGYGFQNAFFNSKIIVDCIVEEKKISIPNKKIGGILDQIFCVISGSILFFKDFFFILLSMDLILF